LGLALLSALCKPGEELSLEDIAAWCDCSPSTIQRIEKAALKKARRLMQNPQVLPSSCGMIKPPKPVRVRPGVRWPGGKSRLLKHLLPLIAPHTCYCEPFSGGLAVLLAKPRSEVEVINDRHGDLVRFYRCVRFHAEALLTELEFVLNSREEFRDFRAQPGLTDIQRAARWFYRNRLCFGGSDIDTFGTSALSAADSRSRRMDAIRELSVRLDRALIEELDWLDCVKRYDRPSTFFFFDPPYTGCSDTAYAAWKLADVMRLREVLRSLKGRWLVTLNDAPDVRGVFADCTLQSVSRPLGISGRAGKGRKYQELIIQP
jgi:DNA adenine methylase